MSQELHVPPSLRAEVRRALESASETRARSSRMNRRARFADFNSSTSPPSSWWLVLGRRFEVLQTALCGGVELPLETPVEQLGDEPVEGFLHAGDRHSAAPFKPPHMDRVDPEGAPRPPQSPRAIHEPQD